MIHEIGKKYLITTYDWFYAPDGQSYKAVFGTVHGLLTDKDTLGIKTNRHSTDWYVSIGNMIVAGCQVFYAIQTDEVSDNPPTRQVDLSKDVYEINCDRSRIYKADK